MSSKCLQKINAHKLQKNLDSRYDRRKMLFSRNFVVKQLRDNGGNLDIDWGARVFKDERNLYNRKISIYCGVAIFGGQRPNKLQMWQGENVIFLELLSSSSFQQWRHLDIYWGRSILGMRKIYTIDIFLYTEVYIGDECPRRLPVSVTASGESNGPSSRPIYVEAQENVDLIQAFDCKNWVEDLTRQVKSLLERGHMTNERNCKLWKFELINTLRIRQRSMQPRAVLRMYHCDKKHHWIHLSSQANLTANKQGRIC